MQLREVARRARTSLATIYKRYGTRDELILAALDCWMEENRYSGLATQPTRHRRVAIRGPDACVAHHLRALGAPPSHAQGLLSRADGAGREKLIRRGFDAVVPAGMEVLADADPDFIRDMDTIVTNVVYGLLGRFAADEIEITEIVASLDRTVQHLTTPTSARARPQGRT